MEQAEPMPRVPDGVRTALGLPPAGPHYFFYRHSAWVRVAHWINALCLAILLMSGLGIFNAHPALYWGNGSNFDHPILSLTATADECRQCRPMAGPGSAMRIRHHRRPGRLQTRMANSRYAGFPAWATLPGPQWLAMARQWHFAFAWLLAINGLLFFAYALVERPCPPRPCRPPAATLPICRTRSSIMPG